MTTGAKLVSTAMDMVDEATAKIAELTARAEEAERERDAWLAIAFYAGRNLFGLTDDQMFRRLRDSVRAWLDDGATDERLRVSTSIRKAAGLED